MPSLIQISILFAVAVMSACGSTDKTTETAPRNISTQTAQGNNAQTITFRDQQFDTYTVSYPEANLAFYLNDSSGAKIRSLANLKDLLAAQGKELLFATNGGMYMKNQEPQGLYIENGEMLKSFNMKDGEGNFYMKPNGVFYLTKTEAGISPQIKNPKNGKTMPLSVRYATQSGPMLVIDGKIHPAFREGSTNLHIRNGVGILPDGKVVFAISQKTVNFYDFASLFWEHFHCKNALYLDGFVSQMHLPELGRQDTTGNFGVIIGVVR